MVLQLEPTAWYDVRTADGLDVLRTIALSSAGLESDPPFDWQVDAENWFSPAGADVADLLAGADGLRFELVHRSTAEPDQEIQDVANELADTGSYTSRRTTGSPVRPRSAPRPTTSSS
jgi:hypothetical protein